MWELYNSKNEMKNPSGNKLEKLVFGMFDQMVEGADKYVTKQGSTWLIFTESRKWVIEFTKDKTLWFNYNVFQNELDLIGKDCTEERDLIKNWFESRFLNKPKIDETLDNAANMIHHIEDTIQNGVKEAHHVDVMKFFDKKMENTIQNGVKNTYHFQTEIPNQVEDVIQEGVKRTFDMEFRNQLSVEDTIQEGVKDTLKISNKRSKSVEDTIQNGVKETTPSGYLGSIEMKGKIVHQIESPKQNNEVEDTIQNGVRHTKSYNYTRKRFVEDTIQNGVKETKEDRLFRTIHVMNTIKNGVKETKESMLESLEQMDHQVTNSEITENINDAIENGVKETKEISNINLMSEIFKVNAKQAIRDGVKELKVWKSNRCEEHGYFEFVDGIPTYTPMIQVKDVLENGVKEIQPLPAQDGNRDWGLYYHRQEDRTKPHTEYVKEVIEDSYNHMGRVEGVIRNTNKDGI
jgi:hypothetical protein